MKVTALSPNLGSYAPDFLEFVSNVSNNPTRALEIVSERLAEFSSQEQIDVEDTDALRYHFVCSLIRDVEAVGGRVWTRDSRLHVSWPDWVGPDSRDNARKALLAARDIRPLNRAELRRVKPLFCEDTDGAAVAEALESGEFWLAPADAQHPSGVKYGEAFSAALRLWSMPYRGRQGRKRRYVVLCKSEALSPDPVVAGLIEMGDEAPFCRWRDDLLGLNLRSLQRHIGHVDSLALFAKSASAHLRSVRRTLLPVTQVPRLNSMAAADIVAIKGSLRAMAAGRSVVDDDFLIRKRIAHGLRLAEGEYAFRQVAKNSASLEDPNLLRLLGSGIRAIKDLVTPRVHVEATVCGAVPPFDLGLGGKLVVTYLAHPDIISLGCGTEGSVLKQSFDVSKLERFLPTGGILVDCNNHL